MTRRSKRWIVALAVPAGLAVSCAAAFGVLELAGADCWPDKIWGDCNTAAQMQLPVFFLGLAATAIGVVLALFYGAGVLARRHRSRRTASGGR